MDLYREAAKSGGGEELSCLLLCPFHTVIERLSGSWERCLGRRVCVYGGGGFHCERTIRRGGGPRVNVCITYGRFKSSTCA